MHVGRVSLAKHFECSGGETKIVQTAEFVVLVLASMFCCVANAQTAASSVPIDVTKLVVNDPSVESWRLYGTGQTYGLVKDDAVPGGSALRIKVSGPEPHPWDSGARVDTGLEQTHGRGSIIFHYHDLQMPRLIQIHGE